jgi:hypothetical protein
MNDAERIRVASANDIAALLGGGLRGEVIETLAASPRFASRLHASAERQLGELPALGPAAVAALALTPDSLSDVVLRAGAVCHATAIALVVDTSARRSLIASLGPDVYAIALEGRGLAPPTDAVARPSGDAWSGAAMRDGASCWSAWRALQPPSIASRLALLGRHVLRERVHDTFGPAIVDWVLGRP